MNLQAKADLIRDFLIKVYPEIVPPLDHTNAHELLFATILSAQSTDVQINKLTPALFAKYPSIEDYAKADLDDIKELVKKSGFYNNKAKNIQAAAQKIISEFGGKVPDTMEQLITIPGAARKTANVVLSQWFGKNEGFAVDTHVIRLSQKWGLTTNTNPEKIEQDLMKLFPQEQWGAMSLRIIMFGRQHSPARGAGSELAVELESQINR